MIINFEDAVFEEVTFNQHRLIGLSRDWPAGFEGEHHYHYCGQLIFASTGSLSVKTQNGLRVISPQRAIWMPPKCAHIVQANTASSFRSLFVKPQDSEAFPNSTFVMFVSPFLRETIVELIRYQSCERLEEKTALLSKVIIGELSTLKKDPNAVHIPVPKDKRVAKIVQTHLQHPQITKSREDWADSVGLSGRTIDRIFHAEIGMSFGAWKRHILLIESLKQLAIGTAVTTIAYDLGYNSVSAFNSLFKKNLGCTPSEYFK